LTYIIVFSTHDLHPTRNCRLRTFFIIVIRDFLPQYLHCFHWGVRMSLATEPIDLQLGVKAGTWLDRLV